MSLSLQKTQISRDFHI